MSRFLTTIPNNSGFYNLGTVEAYPTGGAGPTAYGPNSYYGSDPLPERSGDSLYNPIDLGNFSSVFKTITIKNQHGGLSRRQTTFYKLKLIEPRSIQFTQDFSQFSYEENTNRNTLLAFYQIFEGSRREELPINNEGYVYKESSIDYEEESTQLKDYPSTQLNTGDYLFLITNDIRFLETTYSISINVNQLDWGALNEPAAEEINFKLITETASEVLNFGEV
jgi:hypothetical protein